MAESETRGLLESLLSAFGDADLIRTLLAPEAQWWISPSVGVLGSPTIGREAIHASLQRIFGGLYTGVRISVHHSVVDGDMGTARFTMFATALFAGGRPYTNEYCLWVQTERGSITRVWEYLDVAHALGQFGMPTTGSPVRGA